MLEHGGRGMTELKRCPICGSEAEVVPFYIKGVADRLNYYYFVRCKQKRCKRTQSYRRKEIAISTWNAEEDEQE